MGTLLSDSTKSSLSHQNIQRWQPLPPPNNLIYICDRRGDNNVALLQYSFEEEERDFDLKPHGDSKDGSWGFSRTQPVVKEAPIGRNQSERSKISLDQSASSI